MTVKIIITAIICVHISHASWSDHVCTCNYSIITAGIDKRGSMKQNTCGSMRQTKFCYWCQNHGKCSHILGHNVDQYQNDSNEDPNHYAELHPARRISSFTLRLLVVMFYSLNTRLSSKPLLMLFKFLHASFKTIDMLSQQQELRCGWRRFIPHCNLQ